MGALRGHAVLLTIVLPTLAAKPATAPIHLESDAAAERYLADLSASARQEFIDSETRRRARTAELTKQLEALRIELAHFRPGAPETQNGRTRAQVAREADDRRQERADLNAREDFYAPPFLSPIRPPQVGRFVKARVRRIVGPRAVLIDATDARGKTDTLLLVGQPTAGLAPESSLDPLEGIFRITTSVTPKGDPIPRAERAPDLENASEKLIQAVSRSVDRRSGDRSID